MLVLNNRKEAIFLICLSIIGLGLFLLYYFPLAPKSTPTYQAVHVFKKEQAFAGYNLYGSRLHQRAYLVDMQGQLLHTWRLNRPYHGVWQHVEPLIDGNLLVIAKDQELLKLDQNSKIIWALRGRFHHDLDIAEDGSIFILAREQRKIKNRDQSIPILDDYIVKVSKKGKELERFSLFDIIGHLIPEKRLSKAFRFAEKNKQTWVSTDDPGDVFHSNSIEIVKRKITEVAEVGNLLISLRELNLILIIDLDSRLVKWSWGNDVVERQHHASITKNNNIMLFDNGPSRGWSRVLELDPKTKKILWQYGNQASQRFFSFERGGVELLPNGNKLITVAARNNVFEINPAGEIVWQYRVPISKKKKKQKVILYRMSRLGLKDPFIELLQEVIR